MASHSLILRQQPSSTTELLHEDWGQGKDFVPHHGPSAPVNIKNISSLKIAPKTLVYIYPRMMLNNYIFLSGKMI